MKPSSIWTAGAVVALGMAFADGASAQIEPKKPEAVPARGETVATRPRPELAPLGKRIGTFIAYPKMGLDETYNDNVFAVENSTKDDFITDIKPEVSLESDWSNHALNFSSGADIGRYAEYSRLNYEDFFVRGDGRLDVSRDGAFYLGGGVAREHEDPGEPDAPNDAKNPTEYYLTNGFGRYIQSFGKFRATGETTFLRLAYDKTNTVDGPSQSNTGRDRNIYNFGGRLGYEFQPSYEGFVRVTGNVRKYDNKRDVGGVERNSDGYESVAGVSLDLGQVLFGDVYAGYQEQFFYDSGFNDVGGFTAGGTLTWNVTTLTTLNARAARIIQDTTQAGSPAILRTTGGLSADHELLRNLILNAGVTITNDDYQDVDRNDYYYIGGIGARYLMNRHLYANFGYQFVHHSSDGDVSDDDYDQNLIRIGLEAQL